MAIAYRLRPSGNMLPVEVWTNIANLWMTSLGISVQHGAEHACGGKDANPYGLNDIYGNVAEWVYDRFAADYGFPRRGHGYCRSRGPDEGNVSVRVIRGGSWQDGYGACRAAYRYSAFPGDRSNAIGFRLVKQIK